MIMDFLEGLAIGIPVGLIVVVIMFIAHVVK